MSSVVDHGHPNWTLLRLWQLTSSGGGGGRLFGSDLPSLHHIRMEIQIVDAHENDPQDKWIHGENAQQNHVTLADATRIEILGEERHANAVLDEANGVENGVPSAGLVNLLEKNWTFS